MFDGDAIIIFDCISHDRRHGSKKKTVLNIRTAIAREKSIRASKRPRDATFMRVRDRGCIIRAHRTG